MLEVWAVLKTDPFE